MELPNNVPLPFLDLRCSSVCAADCDGVHITWKVQETGGKAQRTVGAAEGSAPMLMGDSADVVTFNPTDSLPVVPSIGNGMGESALSGPITVGATEDCAPVRMGACADDVTLNPGADSLPVVSRTGNGMAESALSGSIPVKAFSAEGRTSLVASIRGSESPSEEALTNPSMPSGRGHGNMLTQPSLAGQVLAPMTAAAAVPAAVSVHHGSHSVVNTSAAAAAAWPVTVPSATSRSPHIQCIGQEELLLLRPAQAALAHPVSAGGVGPAGILVTNDSTKATPHGTLFDASQKAPTHAAGGHTHDGTLMTPRGNTVAATHDEMLYDMVLSGRFTRKGSSSWCNEDLIAETLAIWPRMQQRLVGDGRCTKSPDSSTGTGSLIAATSDSRGSARVMSGVYPKTSACFVDAPGFSVSAPVIAGSAAVNPPPAAAAAAAAAAAPVEMALRGAAEPARFAPSAWRNKGGSKRLVLEQLPGRSKSATEKLRRHRVSDGFKRLAKAIPASWMRQKQLKNFSSRTDMASLLHIAVDFIKHLQEQKAQLSQAYMQHVAARLQ